MIGNLLAGAVALVLSTPAIPQAQTLDRAFVAQIVPDTPPPQMVFQNYPLVSRVDCGNVRGSAFRIGGNHWLSVAHVTSHKGCTINGEPITVTEQDGFNDFARLDTPTGAPNGFEIDCNGFIPGRWYWAIGYAHGLDFQTAVAIYATIYFHENGMRAFTDSENMVIPGQSGGPVIDPQTLKVVGTVNAYNPFYGVSFSRELKDTSLCKGSASVPQ